jgi:CubicO group peptidase (beta-lactamase class C family)
MFDLDDPVSKYFVFPDQVYVSGTSETDIVTKPVTSPVTIRHLLTHTAGLGYMVLSPKEFPFIVTDRYGWAHTDQRIPKILTGLAPKLGVPGANCLDDFSEFAKVPLAFEPGSAFRYSTSMDCIGHLICVLTGKALDTVVAERVFGPLGMDSTVGWHASDEILERGDIATIYSPSKEGDSAADNLKPVSIKIQPASAGKSMQKAAGKAGHSGGGNILSTSSDVFKFVTMLYNRGVGANGVRVLKPETVAMMMTNQLPDGATLSDPGYNTHLPDGLESPGHRVCAAPQFAPRGVGFGFGGSVVTDEQEVSSVLGPCKAGTYGWLGVFKTEYFIDPASELAVSIHSQVLFGNFGGLMGHASGMYLPDFRKGFAERIYQEIS